VILKELFDNALDAAEEAEIAPEIDIEVSTERGEIVIADNGPGLAAEVIEGILDYTVRVSFALDGARGVTVIESRGQAHHIGFEMDPVRREPRILREVGPSDVQNGTRTTVHWPEGAMLSARSRQRPICTNGMRVHDLQPASDPAWPLE